MLPTELTEQQKQLPDLTDKQLEKLGFTSNHQWKLNAEMLGYSEATMCNKATSVDDFIDDKNGNRIKILRSGRPIEIFYAADSSFNISYEGDVIITQKWQGEDNQWYDKNIFTVVANRYIHCSYSDVPGLNGKFFLVYGKFVDEIASPDKVATLDKVVSHPQKVFKIVK